ncbi:MAG: hypothetical protein JSU00_21505 [Acidobacteria bacterium]|nr:hypothetical protein [Acidobacteriota bacterium]
MTPDPYRASSEIGNPGSWNRYVYSAADPTNLNDPSGLMASACESDVYNDEACRSQHDTLGDCYLNGINVGCSAVSQALASGAALTPEQYVAWWQWMTRNSYNVASNIVISTPTGTTYEEAVKAYLTGLGVMEFIDPASLVFVAKDGQTFGFEVRFYDLTAAVQFLSSNPNFTSGFLGLLHVGDVGFPNLDYRSWTDSGLPFSLQITIGPGGTVWADIDRFNPYTPAGWLLHTVLEVFPWWKKDWENWPRP